MEIHITKEDSLSLPPAEENIRYSFWRWYCFVIGGILVGVFGDNAHHAEGPVAEEVLQEYPSGEGVGAETHLPGTGDPVAHDEAADNAHGPSWVTRLLANLWINNVFFTGLAVIGIFFFAIQYVAQAGWATGFLRIPLAFGCMAAHCRYFNAYRVPVRKSRPFPLDTRRLI